MSLVPVGSAKTWTSAVVPGAGEIETVPVMNEWVNEKLHF